MDLTSIPRRCNYDLTSGSDPKELTAHKGKCIQFCLFVQSKVASCVMNYFLSRSSNPYPVWTEKWGRFHTITAGRV